MTINQDHLGDGPFSSLSKDCLSFCVAKGEGQGFDKLSPNGLFLLPDVLARFVADLGRLITPGERLGVAVSGGPDSLALLVLAAAARPGFVEAITIDHALRPESEEEAALVTRTCASLGVPHDVRKVEWDGKPESALQEQARAARYALIADWLRARGLQAVCTAHHCDDQAETLLMRLARGAGLRGLAAMRPSAPLPGSPDLRLLRPLLSWGRDELADICVAAGVTPVADPSNADEQFERVKVRRLLAGKEMEAAGLARSADNLRSADEAIDWAVEREWEEAVTVGDPVITYLAGTAPDEIRRRILARIIAELASEGDGDLRGREIDQLISTLRSGGRATLRGVLCGGGATWRFEPAPRRISGCA